MNSPRALVHVGVVDFRSELHLERLEGIIWREAELNLKPSTRKPAMMGKQPQKPRHRLSHLRGIIRVTHEDLSVSAKMLYPCIGGVCGSLTQLTGIQVAPSS